LHSKAFNIHPSPDYLAASHHRQGIMSDAVDTVLHNWAIPRMNVRHMLVSMFEGNEGSVKVFLRNGFKMKGTYKDHFEIKGKIRGVYLLEWKYSESD
jgi:RimJ/RimL family protein N-acetyltransferase